MAANNSKYSEEVHKVLVESVGKGVTRIDSFKLVGLHPDTGFDWLRRGRTEPEKYPHFAKLNEDIDTAEAEARAKMTEVIVNSAENSTDERISLDAAKFYLERRDPDNWGKKEKHTIENDSPLVQLTQVVLTSGDARELTRANLRRITGLSADESLGLGMGDEPAEDGIIEVDSR